MEWSNKELMDIKNRILRRVQLVWFMRNIAIPSVSILILSFGALFYALKTRHIAAILENARGLDIAGLFKLFIDAVQKTDADFLVLSVSATLLLLYFGRKLIRESVNLWFGRTSTEVQKI